MSERGEASGLADADPDRRAVDRGAPLDVTVLAGMATRLFNESIGWPLPASDTPVAPVAAADLVGRPVGPDPGGPAWRQVAPADPRPSADFYFLETARPALDALTAPSLTAPSLAAPSLAAPSPAAPSPAAPSPAASPGVTRRTALPSRPHAPSAGTFPTGTGRTWPTATPGPGAFFDVERVRRDFPILSEHVNGHRLVWLDNAATTQKPQVVMDRLARYYAHENSNVHRAAHALAARSTDAYEAARGTVARFLGASSAEEIVFVRGATEAINLVARSWGERHLGAGDEIVLSHLEHHANIVPWQQIAAAKGAHLRVVPVDDDGQVLLGEFADLLGPRTRLVAVTHVSNALGTVVPVSEIVQMAHTVGARVLVDGAQSVAHMRIALAEMDPDFFVFSGHKVFGPTGIGVLWGKREVLHDMPPWQGGGNMIRDVTFERTLFQDPPDRFEAGTGNIADAVGLAAALEYLEQLGLENVTRYEHDLLRYAGDGLGTVRGLRQIGTAADKASVLSFVLDGFAPQEVATALDQRGIAVRAGHHCAQPILRRFGVEATVRPSLALYNTYGEVDRLVAALTDLTSSRH